MKENMENFREKFKHLINKNVPRSWINSYLTEDYGGYKHPYPELSKEGKINGKAQRKQEQT